MSVNDPGGPLNIDQAASLLALKSAADDDDAAPVADEGDGDAPDEEESPIEEAPGEDDALADDDEEETEDEDEDEDAEEDEATTDPAPTAPTSWSKTDQAIWAKLPTEARAVIARREADRDRATKDAAQRAGQAVAELQRISETYEQYKSVFSDGFDSRWGKVDWVTLAQRVSAEEYNQLRAEMEEERKALADYDKKATAASDAAFRRFLQEEAPKLKELAPDIAAPGEPRKRLLGFLETQGFAPERIREASAAELSMAYDAMRYREAKANASRKASGAKTAAGNRPAPKPIRAQPVSGVAKVQATEVRALEKRVAQSRSIEDAANLMVARQKMRAARKR